MARGAEEGWGVGGGGGDYFKYSVKGGRLFGNFSIHRQFTDLTDHNHHTHTSCPGKRIPHSTTFKNLRLD